MGTYVQKINSNYIAAYEVVPNSPLAQTLATIGAGAFQVVSLTTGANPVPDVSNPSTKIIYLTKESGSTKTDPYTEWIYIAGTPGTWEVIGETSLDLTGYKTKQTATTDPTASGTATSFISTITQNANGEISATKANLPTASTSAAGIVQLAGSIGATVSSENNKGASEKAVRDAINALDSNATSSDGTNVQVKVTEADGKITAVNITTDNTENKNNKVTSWSSTPSDTNYPSEKLVKDTINGGMTDVYYESYTRSIKKTVNGAGVEVVSLSTLATDMNLGTAAECDVPASGDASATEVVLGSDSRLTDARTPTSHTHGDINNNGTISASAVTIASGDAVVITDSSASGKVVKSAAAFDGSTTTKALTQKGTFETFYQKPSGGIGTSDLASGVTTSLGLADSSVQDVTVNGTSVVNASTKVAAIPTATSSVYGVVTVETVTI